jgi:putative ABC transport system permease protein
VKYLRVVVRNVFRKKARAFLTMSSIVLVLVLMVVLTSLVAAMEGEGLGAAGASRVFVQHDAGLAQFLPLGYRQRMDQVPGVIASVPQIWYGGTYIDNRPQNFFGQLTTDPATWKTVFDDYVLPPDQEKAWQAQRNSCIAGAQLVERYGWKIGDHIRIRGSYIPIDLDLVVAGIYKGADESNIFFHNSYLENSWLGKAGEVGSFVLRVRSPQDVARVTEAINQMFENSVAPVRAMAEKQFRIQFMEMLGNVKLLVRFIVLTVLFTIVLIVSNTMAMSARERVTEIAVIRALGFQKRQVLGLVLGESVLLSLIGGVLGVAAAYPATALLLAGMKKSPAAAFAYNLHVTPESIGLAFAASVTIGILSGFIPALRSARVPVVSGLRQVA